MAGSPFLLHGDVDERGEFSPAALPNILLLLYVPMPPPLKFNALALPVRWTLLRRMPCWRSTERLRN